MCGRRGPQEKKKRQKNPVKEGNNHLRENRQKLHKQYVKVEKKEVIGIGVGQSCLLLWTASHPNLLIRSNRYTNQGEGIYMSEATQIKFQTLLMGTQASRTP